MELTKTMLKDAIRYLKTLKTPIYKKLPDLLYYKPSDLENLGLAVGDVRKILKEEKMTKKKKLKKRAKRLEHLIICYEYFKLLKKAKLI